MEVSWYGEPSPDMVEYAAAVVRDAGGRVRQDRLLTVLSRGFDTRRAAARSWAQDAMDRGTLVMEWDTTGYPFYVAQTADEGSASLFVACLLAGIVPTVLALLFVAPFLAALSGVVQS